VRSHIDGVRTFVLALGGSAVVGLLYLLCYGGYGGPVDWLMRTERHGARAGNRIALTFDDGPDPLRTPALLDALAALDVKATFFVTGDQVDAHPELAARIAREGHVLGNHTYSHRYLPLARSRSVERELRATDRAIVRATGRVPALARPPYGGRFDRAAKRCVLWDINSFDWKGAPAPAIAERVLERARPGSIVLMHEAREGGEVTVEAVRLLVPALRARGFELVTVDHLS
jgi:peptidoglycan-N-acetylglucosamine deacetylase